MSGDVELSESRSRVVDIVVIACCQRKKLGGTPAPFYRSRLSDILGERTLRKLMEGRKRLATILRELPGADVGFEEVEGPEMLPAWQRYDGNLYRAAHLNRRKHPWKRSLLILSALYGVVDPLDPIRHYELSMKDRLADGTPISQWWNQYGLGQIVTELIQTQPAETLYDLLSPYYRRAIGSWPELPVVQPIYPQGFQADFRRGKDLALLLKGENLDVPRTQPRLSKKPKLTIAKFSNTAESKHVGLTEAAGLLAELGICKSLGPTGNINGPNCQRFGFKDTRTSRWLWDVEHLLDEAKRRKTANPDIIATVQKRYGLNATS
jgi:hypothetical protein